MLVMQLTDSQLDDFRQIVWQYYKQHGRSMPWRDDPSPFHVVLSELMLQQTQVSRVIPKYNAFLYTCDSFASIATQPLSTIIELWSGLGYNRRARYLYQLSQMIVRDYDGQLPDSLDELQKLPGIGRNTAGAIMAYAFNQPVGYVETNIRTVFFHHFFPGDRNVSDSQLLAISEAVCDPEHPREWYWALMDYGAHLKSTTGARLNISRHYKKQSPLDGSVRQVRGQIVRTLVAGPITLSQLEERVTVDERFRPALDGLVRDGLVETTSDSICLTGTRDHS